MTESLEIIAERVDTLGRRVDNHSKRIDKSEQMQAEHGQKILNLCSYQDKQNGSLQRLEARFNGFYNMLFVTLLGLVANIFLTLAGGR